MLRKECRFGPKHEPVHITEIKRGSRHDRDQGVSTGINSRTRDHGAAEGAPVWKNLFYSYIPSSSMPIVPDEAPSTQRRSEKRPDKAFSTQNFEIHDMAASATRKRKDPPRTSRQKSSATHNAGPRKSKRSRETHISDEQNEDDRKMPARESSRTERSTRTRNRQSDNKSDSPAAKESEPILPTASSPIITEDTTLLPFVSTRHLVLGQGAQVWNAHLRNALRHRDDNNSHDKTPVTALEILQQAQDRLRLPPTRFPPRESPLHAIFKATAASPRADPQIFAPLKECYREMLSQDVNVEEGLRQEYKALKPENIRTRIGEIYVLENQLKKKENDLLTKLKGWVSS